MHGFQMFGLSGNHVTKFNFFFGKFGSPCRSKLVVQFPNSVPVTLLLDLTLNFGGRWNKLACQKKRPFHWGLPIRVTKFSVRSRNVVKISSSGTILIWSLFMCTFFASHLRTKPGRGPEMDWMTRFLLLYLSDGTKQHKIDSVST